jgi:hypothetical protein
MDGCQIDPFHNFFFHHFGHCRAVRRRNIPVYQNLRYRVRKNVKRFLPCMTTIWCIFLQSASFFTAEDAQNFFWHRKSLIYTGTPLPKTGRTPQIIITWTTH